MRTTVALGSRTWCCHQFDIDVNLFIGSNQDCSQMNVIVDTVSLDTTVARSVNQPRYTG